MAADVTTKNSDAKERKPKGSFFKKAGRFFRDLKSEFKKVVWPTRKQVLNNTGIVLIFMAISAVGIWALDFLFINLFKLVF